MTEQKKYTATIQLSRLVVEVAEVEVQYLAGSEKDAMEMAEMECPWTLQDTIEDSDWDYSETDNVDIDDVDVEEAKR